MNRVDTAIHRIQDLRPKDFTLSNLDDELASMTLIRSLTEEYSAFALSLLLMDKLEKATIQQAFVTEESQRRHRASAAPNVASALAATSSRSPASSTAECDFAAVWGMYKRPVSSTSIFRIEQGPTDVLVVVRPPRKRTKHRKTAQEPRRSLLEMQAPSLHPLLQAFRATLTFTGLQTLAPLVI